MFLGLLMFGVYCAIMIIILVNMLIAMMSNSYQIIAVCFILSLAFLEFKLILFFKKINKYRIKQTKNGR